MSISNNYDIIPIQIGLSIHETPDEEVKISNGRISIEFYDRHDERMSLSFIGFLGFKETKYDSYDRYNLYQSWPYTIFEVKNSPWVNETYNNLQENNRLLNWAHLGELHHYCLLFHDDIIEILAFDNYELIDTGKRGTFFKTD